MQIINEQYKDKCRYSDFRTTSIYDKITSTEYEEDGSFVIIMKSNYPYVFAFTFLKKNIEREQIMGRSITPKYRLEIDGQKQGWSVKEYGSPTKKNLEKYIHGYGKSLESGGINHHISKMLKYIPYPNYARIVLNKPPGHGDVLVTEWRAHTFQAW